MYGMEEPQENEKVTWFYELMGVIERSEKCLEEPERLEEFDLTSVCREFTDKLNEVTIYEGQHQFWDCILHLHEDARNAIINYYMNHEEDTARKVCENIVSARDTAGVL